MFCKICGTQMKDESKFCPKCGSPVAQNTPKSNEMPQLEAFSQAPDITGAVEGIGKITIEKKKERLPTSAAKIAAAAVILVALVAAFLYFSKPPTLVGQWKCTTFVDWSSVIAEAAETGVIPGFVADMITATCGVLDDLTLTFDGNGGLEVMFHGFSINVGTFTYGDLGNGKIKLKWEIISIPEIGTPISLSKTVEYKLGRRNLTLTVFGRKLKFRRA